MRPSARTANKRSKGSLERRLQLKQALTSALDFWKPLIAMMTVEASFSRWLIVPTFTPT